MAWCLIKHIQNFALYFIFRLCPDPKFLKQSVKVYTTVILTCVSLLSILRATLVSLKDLWQFHELWPNGHEKLRFRVSISLCNSLLPCHVFIRKR